MKKKDKKLKAVDFFCGGGGMSCGLSQAGIEILAGIDIDPECKATYEANHKDSLFIEADIQKFEPKNLAKRIKIKKNDDDLVFIGCSPCQYWSIINTVKEKSEKSKNLLRDFRKFVDYFRPGFVLIENVRGIFKKRKENALSEFFEFLEENDYKLDHNIVNTNHYGVPQKRERFVMIASRVNKKIKIPEASDKNCPVVRDFIGEKNNFPKVEAGHTDSSEFIHTVAKLSDKNIKRLELTPKNGGTRMAWKNSKELQIDAYKGKDNIFIDVYGRMFWDKPAPTITTRFCSISNGRFAHPEENRGLSLREGATLQTFPKDYIFKSNSHGTIARLIGNAVPPEFARRLGEAINKTF